MEGAVHLSTGCATSVHGVVAASRGLPRELPGVSVEGVFFYEPETQLTMLPYKREDE